MNTILAYTIFGLLMLVIISVTISAYNRLVMLKFNIGKAFANIDVLLKQRADEIPNLIKVVKESMKYEESTLTKLTQLRTNFLKTTQEDKKIALSSFLHQMSKILDLFTFLNNKSLIISVILSRGLLVIIDHFIILIDYFFTAQNSFVTP